MLDNNSLSVTKHLSYARDCRLLLRQVYCMYEGTAITRGSLTVFGVMEGVENS